MTKALRSHGQLACRNLQTRKKERERETEKQTNNLTGKDKEAERKGENSFHNKIFLFHI